MKWRKDYRRKNRLFLALKITPMTSDYLPFVVMLKQLAQICKSGWPIHRELSQRQKMPNNRFRLTAFGAGMRAR
jgi:hypothetical protein